MSNSRFVRTQESLLFTCTNQIVFDLHPLFGFFFLSGIERIFPSFRNPYECQTPVSKSVDILDCDREWEEFRCTTVTNYDLLHGHPGGETYLDTFTLNFNSTDSDSSRSPGVLRDPESSFDFTSRG